MDEERKKIVILGGGFGGVYTLKLLQSYFRKDSSVSITLVNKNNYFIFTPLLHEVATGNITPENTIEPLRKLFPRCPIRIIVGDVEKIRTKEKKIDTTHGVLNYDYLIIALGSEPNFYGISGAKENTFTLKSLEDAIDLKNHLIHTFEKANSVYKEEERKATLKFVIVGGGPTGVELAAEMSEFFYDTFGKYYPKRMIDDVAINIIHKENCLLNNFPLSLKKKSGEILAKKRIGVLLNKSVTDVSRDRVKLNDGSEIKTNTVIWTAGVKPREINMDSDFDRGKNGSIKVNEYFEVKNAEDVYVIGDMASFMDSKMGELPRLAQVASQSGYHIAKNIKRKISGKEQIPFKYKHSGDLVSLGAWMAAGEIGPFKIWGHITWFLWRTVYLSKLITWRKKIKVAIDWTINSFLPRDISELYKGKSHKSVV